MKEGEIPQQEIYEENVWAQEDLKAGRAAIGRFRGQTFIFIPKENVKRFGIQNLNAAAERIIGRPLLEQVYEYKISYHLTLPPVLDFDMNVAAEKEAKLQEFINLIMNP